MCSFCVVPFTRGRERSRDPETIVKEASELFNLGYREVTLLGQNVDSYRWNVSKKNEIIDSTKPSVNFAQLLEKVAQIDSKLRVRFSTSHPKDMTDDVLITMSKYDNICKYIHLPVQSGNDNVLKRMNRGYNRAWYLNRIKAIRKYMPDCAISSDIITGFCGETEDEFLDTLTLINEVKYNSSYMFYYSERPKTLAERKFEDDVPLEIKKRRLAEVIELQQQLSKEYNEKCIGKTYEVLVEGISKKSDNELHGRNTHYVTVVFPKMNYKPGDYVNVKITSCTATTLIGTPIK
jgi:tRNA-2-methylthio-N6-dimethylallyladenosine synthase